MYWDKVAKFYDLFERIFNRKVYEETGRRVSEEIDSCDEVLECACGTGAISKYIAPKCKFLNATDFSEKMINQTKRKLRNYSNVSVEFADITELFYADETFHKVVAGNVIHLLDEPYQALEELMRVCKTGGKIIIPTYISLSQKKSGIIFKLLSKSGAGFKRQFDLESYKEFFEKAGYIDVEYDVVQGTIPCAIVVIQKNRV